MARLPIGVFALRLAAAFRDWRSASGEPAPAYFAGNRGRHGGDELTLRASLVRDRLLQMGLGYAPADIEFEAADRTDLVLYAGTPRRPIAGVETKRSSFGDLLIAVQASGETGPQQLERYLRLRGLYLGMLTDGEAIHVFDFTGSREPRASFHLLRLIEVIGNAEDGAGAERALTADPALKNALLITEHLLAHGKWEEVDASIETLNDQTQFQSIALTGPDAREGLVRQVRTELGLLRTTIEAQFALMRDNFARYQHLEAMVSESDTRSLGDAIAAERAIVLDAVPESARAGFGSMLDGLIEKFLATGDIDGFYSGYEVEGAALAGAPRTQLALLLPVSARAASAQSFPLPRVDNLTFTLLTHHRYRAQLQDAHASTLKLDHAYTEWRRRVRGVFHAPEREFCLQTSYIHFVRLFFVRVCEDQGLIERRVSNGPFSTFDAYRRALLTGVSDVYQRLLEETYERASSVYHNFFNRHDLYDWFTMEERSILGILTVLNRYDCSQLDFDVLGRVYNEGYIEEQDRSERGQFYTPHQVVTYMVDALGIPTRADIDAHAEVDAAERRLARATAIDLSCGSGSFLVEIAIRKAAALHKMVARQEINAEEAIHYLTDTLAGFDINPFACYLAEMNVLIRCIPFLRHPQRSGVAASAVTINRLNIFRADALEPTRREMITARLGNLVFGRPAPVSTKLERVSDEEELVREVKDSKSVPGRLARPGGFDYVIGNPPYVRADESPEQAEYRERIRGWAFYDVHGRWDLFVPFIYRNLQFLAPDGRMALITSNAIETEGFAAHVRADLARRRIERLEFFPRTRLFADAAVHNTIFVLSGDRSANPAVVWRIHADASCTSFQELTVDQAMGPERVFRHAYQPPPPGMATCTVPLCSIVYIGTGIVAHSTERHDRLVAGRRQKLFDIDDSFRITLEGLPATEAAQFFDRGVVGADVKDYALVRTRYVAYDAMKEKMYRPRIPELFRTPEKLLLGETSGGYYDDQGIFANHSVQVAVPWHGLPVNEPGVRTVRRESEALSSYTALEAIAPLFDLRYVLAIINSAYMRAYLLANRLRGTREGRIYPDIWKEMPVKVVSKTTQERIGDLVAGIQRLHGELGRHASAADVIGEWRRRGRLARQLTDYVVAGQVRTIGALARTKKDRYELTGDRVWLHGKAAGIMAPDAQATVLLAYLCRYCNEVDPTLRGLPWPALHTRVPMPADVEAAGRLMDEVAESEQARATLLATIAAQRQAIEEELIAAYEGGCDEPLWERIQ